MGRPKASLPLDARGETFLSRIVKTMAAAGIPDVVVVVGAHPGTGGKPWLVRHRRVRVVANDGWEAGQLSSIVKGLDAPTVVPVEAAMVTLVDVPLVSVDTVTTLLHAWRRTRAPIVRPARGDSHGHPVIFDQSLFDRLRRADASIGAKAIIHAYDRAILNVPIDDDGAYQDIDTPGEYQRLLT